MNNTASLVGKNVLSAFSPNIHRGKLIIRKNSPHIFFIGGILGAVTSTVLACRATLKLPETLEEIEKDVSKSRENKEEPHMVPHVDLDADTLRVYATAIGKLGRLYAPAISVGAISICALTGAHVSLSRRNTALMAAYAAVSKAYDDYRERVMKELGSEKELDIYHAATKVLDDQDEDTCVADPNKWSPYARFFDEGSANWEKNAELNRLFVQCQQNYANELLRARGHLFLNEVYDMLGIDRSQAGAVVGWVISDSGDNYVDFGIYDAVNSRFINGWERNVLLDFNVDGVVYDKI